MGLEWRQHLAKNQTVIAGPCLSGARPEYFVLAFLERFGSSILPSERVQFPPFFLLITTTRNRGSEWHRRQNGKIYLYREKTQRNAGKTCAFGYCL